MIHVALLSKWHVHATDYANQAMNNSHISIKKVWDEEAERGQKWAEDLGVPYEANLGALLSDPEIDGVIVDTPTNLHREVIVQAARAGKHIFTEKVLALSTADCDEILKEIEENKVHFMISLPRLTDSTYLYAQDVLDKGLLGKLNTIRCRLAHNGAVPNQDSETGWLPKHFFDPVACGGGALIDLGAHPIYLTNRLAGPAKSVSAKLGSMYDYHQVDDNSIVLVEYQSGALGIIEAGFSSTGSPFLLELHGTEGTLMIEDGHVRLKSDHIEDKGWYTPEKLPDNLPSAMDQWVQLIESGAEPSITKKDAYSLTQINEAAAKSNAEGTRVDLLGGER